MPRTLRVRPPAGVGHPVGSSAADRLRLSVTDACNYACSFCHNEGALQTPIRWRNQISITDARFYVRAAILAGVRTVKLTGGEPLVYKDGDADVASLTKQVCEESAGQAEVSITTNGQLLERHARRLSQTGISHITVSVHTLDKNVFRRELGAAGDPIRQLAGIKAAKQEGLHVKANIVVLPSTRDGVLDLVDSLFAAGVSQVRLYRALWSPLDTSPVGERKVSDRELVSLAAEACGLVARSDVRDYALRFLGSEGQGLPRTLSFHGTRGSVEVDRMPNSTGGPGPGDEGDYALRISAVGDLHARLFSDAWALAPLSAQQNLAEAVRRIADARRELNAVG